MSAEYLARYGKQMDGSLVMLIGVMFELMAERKGVYI
jgi:hypothetical protein